MSESEGAGEHGEAEPRWTRRFPLMAGIYWTRARAGAEPILADLFYDEDGGWGWSTFHVPHKAAESEVPDPEWWTERVRPPHAWAPPASD